MKRPYITLKFAQTLDGRIAAKDGSSRWISCPASRKFAHKLRVKNDAVLVGAGTVLADDPSLTAYLVKGKNPTRVIVDGKLTIPLSSQIVKSAGSVKTIIVTARKTAERKKKALKKKGVHIITMFAGRGSKIDLKVVMRILYEKGIRSILVEGGKECITSFIKAGLADSITVIVSPKIMGKGIESIGDLGTRSIKEALPLSLRQIKRLGNDIIYKAKITG